MLNMLMVAVAPSVALLIFIYQKDRYDREPPSLLIKLFVFGIISTIPVYFTELFLIDKYERSAFYQAFIVAGFVEEIFKFLVLFTLTFKTVHYNEKLDGIIYSVFVSMGFATAENILYIFSRQPSYLYTGISRAIFAVPAHAMFAITMGYYLSLSKFTKGKATSRLYLFQALLIPVILHGIYDYILLSRMYGFLVLFILFVIYLWRVNLVRLDRYVEESRRES